MPKVNPLESPRTIVRGLSTPLALPLSVRLAATVWVLLLVGVSVRVAVQQPNRATVVPIYLDAGQRWAAGSDLYEVRNGLDVYRNPPGVAAGFAALSPLPPKAAAIVWRLCCAAVLLTGLVRFRQAISPQLSPNRTAVLFTLAAVLAAPAINNGQVNVLLAASALHGVAALAGRRWWAAAGWLALGGWLKVYPLAVGLLAAVPARRLRWPLAAVLVAGFLAPFLVQSPGYVWEQYAEFIGSQRADDRTYAPLTRVPRDWTVLPRTWLGVVVTGDTAKVVSVCVAVVLAGVMVSTGRRGDLRESAGRAAALGCGWMTAFGPATEGNTYTVLCGVAAWLAVDPSRSRWAAVLARVGCGLLLAGVFGGLWAGVEAFERLGPQPLGTALLMLAAVGRERQEVTSRVVDYEVFRRRNRLGTATPTRAGVGVSGAGGI